MGERADRALAELRANVQSAIEASAQRRQAIEREQMVMHVVLIVVILVFVAAPLLALALWGPS